MAGLFGDLFVEDKTEFDVGDLESDSAKSRFVSPPSVRPQCGLSGIDNQGATCYLNSLIQTLLYTPEFRESLFCLGNEELGCIEDIDKPDSKVRVIPIQLQRLFARLLLKNCQSVSTVDLTTSFGWTDNEQFQQHDVQELNRILFSAIDSSLVGTSGRDIINRLYHGKAVNQIRCTQCGKISEREEDFLDITVTVSGNASLEQALQALYLDVEMLDGKNQYRCGSCQSLVDAAKGARIRSLPSILTVSLLRFSFDFRKMERYKETGKFTFPQNIDMRPYCDQPMDDLDYELFSIVIHSGGAHGGHYHAYIRDIDSLGNWVTPEDEEILVPSDPTTGGVDLIECDSPIELVQYALSRQKTQEMSIDKLGQEILKQTGTSWNKRFKSRHGPITKFVSKYDDKFHYDPIQKLVSLKNDKQNSEKHNLNSSSRDKNSKSVIPSNRTGNSSCTAMGNHSMDITEGNIPVPIQGDNPANVGVMRDSKNNENLAKGPGGDLKSPSKARKEMAKPTPGKCWFDFNDARVHPIYDKSIEKQFSGREGAYMLFYRKKALVRPDKALGNKTYCIPDDLVTQVVIENQDLDKDREVYDVMVNTATLQIHFGSCYRYIDGALKPLPGTTAWRELSIDRRKPPQDLFTAIREFGSELVPDNEFQLNILKELPAGSHMYDAIPEHDDTSLQKLGISDGSRLFVWDGESIQGQYVPTGVEAVPVFLTVIYGEKLQFSRGFSREMTLEEVKVIICDIIRTKFKDLVLKRLSGKNTNIKTEEFTAKEHNQLVAELNLNNGDQLLAEDRLDKGPGMSTESIRSTLYSTKFLIHVENRCVIPAQDSYDYPTAKVEVDREICVAELKAIAMSRFGLCSVDGGGRLRVEHDTLGLRHPIHEEKSVFESGITQGSTVVLEPGPTPKSDQITLTLTPNSGTDFIEVMVTRMITVAQCLQCILDKANITEGDWHLRKTNWCGEPAELLDDPDLSLDASLVNDGDHILLEQGRLPPKGFLRLPIWLFSTPESVKTSNMENQGVLSWISTGICNILQTNTSTNELERNEKVATKLQPFYLGEVEISKEASLDDLKQQVMTLNVVAELPIASEFFMRLRLLENNRLSTVLKDGNQTLKRLRLTSTSVLALQILPEEETLNQHQLVLDVCQRIHDTRRYHPSFELIWDTSQGASINSLRQAISDVLYIPIENLAMAKHFPQRFEWMVIEKMDESGHQKGKKGGHSRKNQRKNIKQAPFHIHDGDTIGVKDKQCDPNNLDDLMTDVDEVGRILLSQQAEEKRQIREERKKMIGEFGQFPREKRPEVGIKIKVGDFS